MNGIRNIYVCFYFLSITLFFLDTTMDDIHYDTNNVTHRKYHERIDDLEQYLKDEDIDSHQKGTSEKKDGVYSVFYKPKPIVPKEVNGTLLPMEQRDGNTKLSIPDFVLKSSSPR